MELSLSAPIVAVTCFPSRARIVRRGRLDVPAGASTVVLADLPTSIDPESLRASGHGAASILGVDLSTERLSTDSGRRAELDARREELRGVERELADRRDVLETRASLLRRVADKASRPLAQQIGSADADPGRAGSVAWGLGEQLAGVLAEQRALLAEEREVADRIAAVERETGDVGEVAPDRVRVAVALEASEAGEVDLEISYLVDGASWEPRYDVTFTGERVEVAWFAMVSQWTGEDWPETALKVSTARPTGAVTVPELEPWYVSAAPPPSAMPRMAMASAPMMFDADASAAPLAHKEAVLEQGATAATYTVQRPVAVASGSGSHAQLLATLHMPATVDYIVAPVRSDDVVLRATVTNTSPHTLRAGQASLFQGPEFVGASRIETWAPGEARELALGVDDRIRVERDLQSLGAGKSMIGGTRRHEARWRTTIANHTGREARVTVLDQLPVSRSAEIVVKDVQITPSPASVDDLGTVTWVLTLAEGGRVDLTLAYRVDVARGTRMMGWRE